ncbi:MAG: methyltransferase domain-containing protein [candidate division Zixibacteria bacterium]|nr:methyltransferase domain-containing protein [candidate division Zixibacteria bacterium]
MEFYFIVYDMNTKDRFNQFYNNDDLSFGDKPTYGLLKYVDLDKVDGEVLDLGCGDGRNTLYLAQQGIPVTALDTSDIGLDKLMGIAVDRGIDHLITPVCADVRRWNYPIRKFDLLVAITIFDHLEPSQAVPAFIEAVSSIRSHGTILSKVHTTEDPGHTHVGNSSGLSDMIHYYFKPGELLDIAKPVFDIIHYEEYSIEDDTHGPVHFHHFAELAGRKK